MKKLFILMALPLLLIATTAFGERNLVGCWKVVIDCLETVRENNDPEADISEILSTEEEFCIKIQNQDKGLFELYNCVDTDADPCVGAIDGKYIHTTCWDNIITGVLKGNKMSIITHGQFPDLKEAKTCKGTAKKVDDLDCESCLTLE